MGFLKVAGIFALAWASSADAFLASPKLALGRASPAVSSSLRSAQTYKTSSSSLQMTIAMPPPTNMGGPLPSIEGMLPDCPATKWDAENLDIAAEQAKYRKEGIAECIMEVVADDAANAKGVQYFEENREKFRAHLDANGAVVLRNFDLSKNPEGFRRVCEALDLKQCLDPIHSSGLRSFLSAKDGVYEEVNKQSLAKHYIGLHNEATFCKTAAYGAFVCFSPASKSGGEFFIADGAKIFRDMDTEILKEIYDKKVRISVSNLDLDFLNGLGPLKEPMAQFLKGVVASTVAPKFEMDLDMIFGADGKEMRLQAIEHPQSPVNRHPVNGMPLWFCNVHNHARYLRDRRPCSVPEVGMTDVYYGDLSYLPAKHLEHINEVSNKHIETIAMKEGDVLLIDNYRVLHGRDVFEGDRLHAVSWFRKGDEEDTSAKDVGALNSVINKFIN